MKIKFSKPIYGSYNWFDNFVLILLGLVYLIVHFSTADNWYAELLTNSSKWDKFNVFLISILAVPMVVMSVYQIFWGKSDPDNLRRYPLLTPFLIFAHCIISVLTAYFLIMLWLADPYQPY